VATLYKDLMGPAGRISEDWFARQVAIADRTDGDIDTLATRLAHIRTWTFVSNRADWLQDPAHWQGRTRAIEDALSDALHECLTQRFVDRRTSALMKGMRDKEELQAEIKDDGSVNVEQHYVGRLRGFRFTPDAQAEGVHGKAARSAAAHVLSGELAMRARRVAAAQADAFKIDRKGQIIWRGEEIANLVAGEDPLKPSIELLVDEHLSQPDREKIQARLDAWLSAHISEKLKPLVDLSSADDVSGLARGIAFRLKENFGVLKREAIAEELKSLDQSARAQLRKYGVRFGAFNIHFPLLLKPAAADLTLTLWALKNAASVGLEPNKLPEPPRPGLTSAAADPATPEAFYRAFGYHVCGPRVIRFDMLERLADMIRPLLAWRANRDPEAKPPKGSTGDGGFVATPEMMSILGCSPEELGKVLKGLGFRLDRRPVKAAVSKEQGLPTVPDQAASPDNVEPAAEAATQPPEELAALETAGPPPVDAAATTDAAPTAQSEVQFEEVWRPRRHHREGHERGEGRPEHRRRDRRHGRRPAGGAPEHAAAVQSGEAGTPAAPGVNAETGSAEHRPHGGGKRDQSHRPGNRDKRGEKRDDRSAGSRPEHGPRKEGRRDEQRREPRRDQRRDDRREPRTLTAAPPRGKGSAESDSPFASLLALRSQLEQASRDKS
jgi:ATP-dependent RNA helicase SUPV3L1/SUV3